MHIYDYVEEKRKTIRDGDTIMAAYTTQVQGREILSKEQNFAKIELAPNPLVGKLIQIRFGHLLGKNIGFNITSSASALALHWECRERRMWFRREGEAIETQGKASCNRLVQDPRMFQIPEHPT